MAWFVLHWLGHDVVVGAGGVWVDYAPAVSEAGFNGIVVDGGYFDIVNGHSVVSWVMMMGLDGSRLASP